MSSPEPIQSPVGAVEAARRESQEAAYKQLHATLTELDRLDVPVLEDSHLQALGIRKLPDLDADEHAPFDPEPLFFRPYPFDEEEGMPEFVNGALPLRTYHDASRRWKKPCVKSYCPGGDIALNIHCSSKRFDWVYSTCGPFSPGILSKTKWDFLTGLYDDDYRHVEEDVSRGFFSNGELLTGYGTRGYYELCAGNRDEPDLSKPHMGAVVCDATRSSQATLASEVAAALMVLKFRLRRGDFVNFHTLPVIVYSFHHDESARITRVHWDGKDLVIRQSRLLDLRGEEPTSDAYRLVRWMANKPVGETAYVLPQDTTGLETGGKPRPGCATRWDISVGA